MGVISGLTIGSAANLANLISSDTTPSWLDFSKTLAQLTGSYKLVNLTTGLTNLSNFLFRTPKWPIGGVYFDGILRTEHSSRVHPTQYPVQTGVSMTDHAIVMPAELTVEIMMTDAATSTWYSANNTAELVYLALKLINQYSNTITEKPSSIVSVGEGRSAAIWTTLKAMQQSRVPITVETRLQTYNNMIIEDLSAPDDNKTYHALKCTVRLREIIMAGVSETQTSARSAQTTPLTTTGNSQSTSVNMSAYQKALKNNIASQD